MRIIWNTVPNNQAEDRPSGGRIVHTGLMVETGGATINECLNHPLVPKIGTAPLGEAPNHFVVYRNAVAYAPGVARLYIHLSTLTTTGGVGGTPIESFAEIDETSSDGRIVEIHPGTNEQLVVYRNNSTAEDEPHEVASVSDVVSLRRLTFQGLFKSRPSGALQKLQNCVNDKPWNEGKKGTWLCDHVEARFSNRDGLYQVTVSVKSQGGLPWFTVKVMRDMLGRNVRVNQEILNGLKEVEYEYGVVYNTNAILLAGLKPLADFDAALKSIVSAKPHQPIP